MITKSQLEQWALRHGFCLDNYGHYQKVTTEGKIYRLSFNKLAVRYEVKIQNEWVRISSGYYKNISISSDDKLAGLSK